ncbi:MAG: hypothetical protein HY075_05610 [Deltaproteobacteria bacterium]|nr:hypothetical protein [Deltaproteobacteria bacterium]
MAESGNNWARPLSRRSFLRWTALAGVASVAGWRFLAPSQGDDPGPLQHLSANQARILAAAYATITLEKDPARLREAVSFMDGFVGRLDDHTRLEFKAALLLVEHSPFLFHGYLGRFTALGDAERARCLEGWRSGFSWRRPVFGALKDLSYLHKYTRPGSWAAIGYGGPLVAGGGAHTAFEKRYRGLVEGER